MKYKCTNKYEYEGELIMCPGDIISVDIEGMHNITTGKNYSNIPIDMIKGGFIAFTDESTQPNFVTSDYTDISRFSNITKNMIDLFKRKNHDYGNSFELSLNEEGLAAARIRMGDKWNRFKTLSKNIASTAQVTDESLRDTLLDLANYAIMTMIWLDKNYIECDSERH